MVSKFEEDLTKMVASTVKVKKFNQGDEMPFQYVCPDNDKLVWTCGEDQKGKITSVFNFSGNGTEDPDRMVSYLNKEEAIHIRDELIKSGWIASLQHDTTLTYPGMKPLTVGKVELNRRQRRNFSKTMNQMSNPGDHRNKKRLLEEKLKSKDQGETE
jgi:hypothetical protein